MADRLAALPLWARMMAEASLQHTEAYARGSAAARQAMLVAAGDESVATVTYYGLVNQFATDAVTHSGVFLGGVYHRDAANAAFAAAQEARGQKASLLRPAQ